MKIQNFPANSQYQKFCGNKKTTKSNNENNVIKHSIDPVKSFAILSSAIAATLALYTLPPQPAATPVNTMPPTGFQQTQEEKVDLAKKYLQEAIDTIDYTSTEAWDVLSEAYKTIGPNSENAAGYEELIKIATGESKPWTSISNKEEAINLIANLINLACTYSGDIDGTKTENFNISKPEANVIYLVLDNIENINPSVQQVAVTFRTELEHAAAKSAEEASENSLETKISYDYYQNQCVQVLDNIEEQAEKIQSAKIAYNNAKTDYLNCSDDNKSEKLQAMRKALATLESECSKQLIVNGINTHLASPSFQITHMNAQKAIDKAIKKLQ